MFSEFVSHLRKIKRENMTKTVVFKSNPATSGSPATVGRLFVQDLSGGRVFSLNADGSDQKVIVTECRHPDGIVVDVKAGHIYWTNMDVPNLTTVPSSAPTSTGGIVG
jgi:hypothetical protein